MIVAAAIVSAAAGTWSTVKKNVWSHHRYNLQPLTLSGFPIVSNFLKKVISQSDFHHICWGRLDSLIWAANLAPDMDHRSDVCPEP